MKEVKSKMNPKVRRFRFLLKQRLASISFLKVFLIALIIIFFFTLINIYNTSYKPQIKKLAQSKGDYILNIAVDKGINRVIEENALTYTDLITILKDDSGKITGLMTNLVGANRLRSAFSVKIGEELEKLNSVPISIPLGNLTKIDTLSGLGPKIKINLIPAGKVNIDFKNDFAEAGINQTKHEIYLDVSVSASLLMPAGIYERVEHTLKIPLCESIIVGEIPDTITRLETRDETLRDDILNID